MEHDASINKAREVLQVEADSILSLIDKLDDNFTRAVETIYKSKGRVIVTGIGKSGIIGKKIAATMTSTPKMSAGTMGDFFWGGGMGALFIGG